MLLPDVRFLTLAVALFTVAKLLMHGLFFPIALKKVYNPGLLTALIGLVPLSIAFFAGTDLSFTRLNYL
ncbi:TPA: HXXEE domain-containing protein [Streptococcus suis]